MKTLRFHRAKLLHRPHPDLKVLRHLAAIEVGSHARQLQMERDQAFRLVAHYRQALRGAQEALKAALEAPAELRLPHEPETPERGS